MTRVRRSSVLASAFVGVAAVAGLGGGVVSVGAAAARPPSRAHDAPPAPRPLDHRVLAFREDAEPARVVAEVTATVEVHADGVHVTVTASATGPRVHGAPGPLGVHGGNRITAEELSTLLARDGLGLRTREGAGRATGPRSPAAVVTRGGVRERRIDPDGRVRHVETGGAGSVLGVAWTSAALPDGTTTLEVVADDRVRVRCVVRVGADGARVVRLVQLDEHGDEVGP